MTDMFPLFEFYEKEYSVQEGHLAVVILKKGLPTSNTQGLKIKTGAVEYSPDWIFFYLYFAVRLITA